jgi:hypothetical protein
VIVSWDEGQVIAGELRLVRIELVGAFPVSLSFLIDLSFIVEEQFPGFL